MTHPASVTVYIRPGCDHCQATCDTLDEHKLNYVVVDITKDPEARDYVMALGYLQTPVVVTAEKHWSGLQPDRISALVA